MAGGWNAACQSLVTWYIPGQIVRTAAPQALTNSLKASTYSQPLRTRCRVTGTPPRVPNSSGFQLVPQAGLSQDEWMDATISPLCARIPAEVLRTINAIRAATRTAKWTGDGIGVQIRGRPEAVWWWVERVAAVRDLQNQRKC